MADRFTIPAGSPFAEASKAAMEEIRNPQNQAALQGDDDTPATDDAGTPQHTDDGPSPEEPVHAGSDDEPEAAERADGEAETPQQVAQTDDADKFWNQYKTDEERKRGLAETKLHAAKLSRELQELKAKQAAPAPVAPVPPAPRVTPRQYLQEIAQKDGELAPEEYRIREAINYLGQMRTEATTAQTSVEQHRDAATQLEKQVNAIAAVLEDLREDLKSSPDDQRFMVEEKIARKERQLESLESKHENAISKLRRLEDDHARQHRAWESGVSNLFKHVETLQSRQAEQAQASERTKADTAKAEHDWATAFPRVLEKFKLQSLPPTTQARINKRLLKEAYISISEQGDIPNIEQWMLERGPEIREEIDEIRSATLQAYADGKRADAEQPAPRGRAAVATDRKESPRSWQEIEKATARAARAAFTTSR